MEEVRKFNIRTIITSIVLIILGIAIIANPDTILSIVVKILGVGVILDGMWHVIQFAQLTIEEKALSIKLVQGIGEVFLGIMAMAYSTWVISIIYIIIGLWIALENILKLQMNLLLKNVFNNRIVPIIISVLGVLIGIFIMANPVIVSEYVNIMIGITMIIAELLNLIESIYIAIKIK